VPDLPPCDCPGCPNVFSGREVEDTLKRYRRKGPDPSTRLLTDAIEREGVAGATILDIGGGVGAIQIELLGAGATSAVSVDASPEFVTAARAEAAVRGLADRIEHREGDFVALAAEIPSADIVTLDRMVCCYSDMPRLVARAVDHSRRLIGLVYPRDTWWLRGVARVLNLGSRLTRSPLRWYVHPEQALDELIRRAGFERTSLRGTFLWRVALYRRSA
jgi:SAM-dependent methyltransferase